MTTHWKCCCGCQPGGPFKAGIINAKNETGEDSGYQGAGQRGGYLSILKESNTQGIVNDVISATNLTYNSDGVVDPEKESALLSVVDQSCVLTIGLTQLAQSRTMGGCGNYHQASWRVPSQNCSTCGWTDGIHYSKALYYMPDPNTGDDSFDNRVIEAIGDKVCTQGGLLIIVTGNPEDYVSHYPSTGGCAPNHGRSTICGPNGSIGGVDNRCEGTVTNHVQLTNDFLEKLRLHKDYEALNPTNYPQGVIECADYMIDEHGDNYGADQHTNNGSGEYRIHEYLDCSLENCGLEECGVHCYDGDEDCMTDGDLACDQCGPFGSHGRETFWHWNYNVFRVGQNEGVGWLNDPIDEDYDANMYIQEQHTHLIYGGVPIHDLVNIDGHSIAETGFVVERFGKGHVLVWGNAQTFAGGINGNCGWSGTVLGAWTCIGTNSGCYTGGSNVGNDNYGLWPYEKNSHVIARIINRLVGKDVEALK